MNKRDRAILYGFAIGDGHISYRSRLKDGKYKYESAELVMAHSPKQYEYLKHKRDLLHSILGGKKNKLQKVSYTLKTTGKTYPGWRVVKTAKYFRQMHKALYGPSRQKRMTGQVLSYLDEHSLALWYMDDGSILPNQNKKGETTSLSFRICTQFIDKDEADFVVEWLHERFGIEAKSFKAKDKWDIGGATGATLQLVYSIQDYVIPSMLYKIEPAYKFVFRKSAKHPNFKVDDDIVQSLGKPEEAEA